MLGINNPTFSTYTCVCLLRSNLTDLLWVCGNKIENRFTPKVLGSAINALALNSEITLSDIMNREVLVSRNFDVNLLRNLLRKFHSCRPSP